MKTLNIVKEEEHQIIRFNELMDEDGSWISTNRTSGSYDACQLLDYSSDTHEYYLVQNESKSTWIVRCKR